MIIANSVAVAGLEIVVDLIITANLVRCVILVVNVNSTMAVVLLGAIFAIAVFLWKIVTFMSIAHLGDAVNSKSLVLGMSIVIMKTTR